MFRFFACSFCLLLALPLLVRAESILQPGDRIAICGDSITEQRAYSVYIEDYLLMCGPMGSTRALQFGFSGEVAGGLLARMETDLLPFSPTVATTCYGMNDGGYAALTPERAQRYREDQGKIIQALKKAGVRRIVVGSPGCVDSVTYTRGSPAVYNGTLGQLRDIAREVAQQHGVIFADLYAPMLETMAKAKARYGPDYAFAGGDGVHASRSGSLVMAYAFLKALGCDGNIGTISVDMASNQAQASEGHKVLSVREGAVELESSRYPFCFFGDPKSAGATSGIIEVCAFNSEVNRLVLKVSSTSAARLKVTWGAQSKVFDVAVLAKGINLAAEFIDNPFSEPFRKVDEAVRQQQMTETSLIKGLLHNLPGYSQQLPEQRDAFERIRSSVIQRCLANADAPTRLVLPVRHTIKIEPATP